jgi:hypothetical protein
VLVALLVLGVLWGMRWVSRNRPVASSVTMPGGYLSDISALRTEYSRYYGKPIEESALENRFRQATDFMGKSNLPGASSSLELLSRKAALPVVYNNLGVVYYSLGDYARAADAFREVLARDADYASTRQFLRGAKSIPFNSADPYTREVEPNNEPRTATLIALGVPVGGEVSASTNDVDVFRAITPPAPRDRLTITLANHSIDFSPRLHIYDESMRLLSWGEETAKAGQSIDITGGPPPNAAIYISIAAADNKSGIYVLTVKPQKAFDKYEPDDDIMSSHRISVGEDVHANIMDADDTDFYSFQSPRKGTVTIEIRNESDTLIPGVTTYNTDRRNTGFGPEVKKRGAGLHHVIDVEKDRLYYIQVWSQAGSSGAYTLRVD